MSGVVAIVGRPNVGKSTLFNRFTESRDAIVDEIAGVTRDRHYGMCNWNGKSFTVIDTGGYIEGSDDVFEDEIQKQVRLAIDEADVILFLVDVVSGITDMDEMVADLLRRSRKPVVLVVNKVDNGKRFEQAVEFYGLGLGEYITVSSMNGSGTGDVLDEAVKYIKADEEEEISDIPRIAIVGRPNVGKSSLTNALLGEDRNIVTPVAGTTRDAISTRYTKFGHDLFFVDTAGLRKKAKVEEDLEFYSVLRTISAIEKSDVCLLLIDAKQGLESQDQNIMHLIIKNQKGVVLCVNKWDLIEKDTKTAKEYEERLRYQLAPFNDIPIMFTSVLNKQRIFQLVEKAVEVCNNRKQKIATSKLNEIMLPEIEAYPPPSVKGKYVKIKYITQIPTYAPQFAFFCSNSKYVREPYRRYLENKLRSHFNFEGVPIRIYMREK